METLVGHVLESQPVNVLVALGAVMARVGAAVWIAPFLGGKLVPTMVKAGLTLLFALMLHGQVAATLPSEIGTPLALAILAKEVFVGVALGFVGALVFWAAEAAGRLADTARGANLAEVLVPQSGMRTSPLGELSFQLTLVLFIVLGGHRIFITALGASYLTIPVAAFPDVHGLGGFALLSGRLTADLFLIALSLAAPVVATIFLTDVTLGLINRFTPQVNVFFLAMPAKAMIGIGVLVLAAGLLLGALPPILDRAMLMVDRALSVLGG